MMDTHSQRHNCINWDLKIFLHVQINTIVIHVCPQQQKTLCTSREHQHAYTNSDPELQLSVRVLKQLLSEISDQFVSSVCEFIF